MSERALTLPASLTPQQQQRQQKHSTRTVTPIINPKTNERTFVSMETLISGKSNTTEKAVSVVLRLQGTQGRLSKRDTQHAKGTRAERMRKDT